VCVEWDAIRADIRFSGTPPGLTAPPPPAVFPRPPRVVYPPCNRLDIRPAVLRRHRRGALVARQTNPSRPPKRAGRFSLIRTYASVPPLLTDPPRNPLPNAAAYYGPLISISRIVLEDSCTRRRGRGTAGLWVGG